jgi:5-methylcytosine-specific restriction endonuclease McrA
VRDGFCCVYCSIRSDFLQLDHLFPRASRWRDNDQRRLVSCCQTCNTEKGAMAISDWLRHLRDSKGVDVREVYRRLQTARYVPLNRRAGDRALAAHRALYSFDPPEGFVVDWDEVPF